VIVARRCGHSGIQGDTLASLLDLRRRLPGRGQHDALDALFIGICSKKVSFILDADIRWFFTEVSQEWVVRFLEPL
jgi:hypothetical protein